ncbi:hypothetical protein IAT40_007942 [Kwoniella sp. CBS 6097]
MSPPRDFVIDPPLLNTACPWATNFQDLLALYRCQDTGATTTRTSMLNGFAHDDSIHQYRFFDPVTHDVQPQNPDSSNDNQAASSSLNTLGYSPHPLKQYLDWISEISESVKNDDTLRDDKLVIVSVTGTPEEVGECYRQVIAHQERIIMPLAVEINLSCPNIPGKPPPAYSSEGLIPYLDALLQVQRESHHHLPLGLKLPPYTYSSQFTTLVDALRDHGCYFTFLTSTNTLGNSLLVDIPPLSLPATVELTASSAEESFFGLGGLAGTTIHPLSLGNVRSLRHLLDQHPALKHIKLLGVGGVEDSKGFRRMMCAGAYAVGVATALGRKGTAVFTAIRREQASSQIPSI